MSEPTGLEPPAANPPQPDLAGYPDVSQLAQGYRASGAEAQRQKARADALEQQVHQLVAAANQQRGPDPYARLSEYGDLGSTIREVVRNETTQIVQEALQPLAKGFQARSEVMTKYPDYVKFEQDVATFINSDPQLSQEYQELFRTNPATAMKYAFLAFGDSRRGQTPPPPQNGAPGAVHASIPSNRAGDSRRGPDPNDNVRAAFERYQQTGSRRDAEVYARARLRGVITDEFLNQ